MMVQLSDSVSYRFLGISAWILIFLVYCWSKSERVICVFLVGQQPFGRIYGASILHQNCYWEGRIAWVEVDSYYKCLNSYSTQSVKPGISQSRQWVTLEWGENYRISFLSQRKNCYTFLYSHFACMIVVNNKQQQTCEGTKGERWHNSGGPDPDPWTSHTS